MLSKELDGKVSAALLRVATTVQSTLAGFEKDAAAKLVEVETLEAEISEKQGLLAEITKDLSVAQKDKEIELAQWTKTANLRAVTEKAQELGCVVVTKEESAKLNTAVAEAESNIRKEVAIVTSRLEKEKTNAVAEANANAALVSAQDKADLRNALSNIDSLKEDKAVLIQQLSDLRASWEKASSAPVQVYASSKG